MAAKKKAAVVRAEVSEVSEPELVDDGIDLTVDPDEGDTVLMPTLPEDRPAKVEFPDDKPAPKTVKVRWRLLANVFLGGGSYTPAGTVVDLTDVEVEHLRKTGSVEQYYDT